MDKRLRWRTRPLAAPSVRLGNMALYGALLGALMAAVLTAPATWLGAMIAGMTDGRVQWRDASGTVWNGQATLTLGAGPGSLTQLALPQRLTWRLRPGIGPGGNPGLTLNLQHPLLMPQPIQVRAHTGWKSASFSVQKGSDDPTGPMRFQAPAAWLAGLGAPWNTLQPSGQVVLQLERLEWSKQAASPPSLDIALTVQLLNIASRVSTLPVLGHYNIEMHGGPAVLIQLATRPGSALLLEGQGQWRPGEQVGFRGQASAAEGREEALSNLLNIIGRREGARSLIAIGSSPAVGKPPAPTQ